MYLRKATKSKLDPFADQLEEWFEVEKRSARDAQQLLEQRGCKVSHTTVLDWWRRRQMKKLQDQLLCDIAESAQECSDLEAHFAKNPAPAIDILIKLHRVAALRLNKQGQTDPDLLRLMTILMKPVLDWARLEEQRKVRESADGKGQAANDLKGASEAVQSLLNQALGLQ